VLCPRARCLILRSPTGRTANEILRSAAIQGCPNSRADFAAEHVTDAAYNTMANQHRPDDPAALAVEIRRLHADGLTARDIAEALRLAPDVVINILYSNGENRRNAWISID
jgi:hypothetical protein